MPSVKIAGPTRFNLPPKWKCPTHLVPTVYGCMHCEPIAKILRDLLAHDELEGAKRLLAAELYLEFEAEDFVGSISKSEVKRSRSELFEAALFYAAAKSALTPTPKETP